MSTKTLSFINIPRVSSSLTKSTKPKYDSSAVKSNIGRTSTSTLKKGSKLININSSVQSYIGVGLAFCLIISSITYVFGINSNAATGYEIKNQQKQVEKLQTENKKLLVKTAELNSISKIQNTAEIQNLVSITSQEFLQPNYLTQR